MISKLMKGLEVSIPNRDFDELQFYNRTSVWAIVKISIPNRDFDELQSGGCPASLPNPY